MLFFQCVAALFNPVHRRGESIKWGLVSFTVAMFSAVSIQTAADLNIESISYIENREFPGAGGAAPPGPLGYQFNLEALTIVSNLMSNMNNWLADGLLVSSLFDTVDTRRVVNASSSSSSIVVT